MITRRNLFKGLIAAVGAVVLKPFAKARSKGITKRQYSFEDKYIGNWNEVLSLPYIDLNDGQTGSVKYTTDRSIGNRDNHLRLTIDFREKGLDITLTDGSLIRVTSAGSWMRYNNKTWEAKDIKYHFSDGNN